MTLEKISKEEMEYVLSRDKTANVIITNRQHPNKKTRYLEMSNESYKWLMEYRDIQKSRTVEKHGYFEEEYIDRYGQKRTHEVFYK